MATTYATNAEIRALFPQIDNLFPCTKLNGASTSPATTLTVDSTDAFPATGTLGIISTGAVLTELVYTQKSSTVFYLSAATAVNFADNQPVGVGSYLLDTYRPLAKAWVDTVLTNPNIPADYRKDLEARRVYVMALQNSMDPNMRAIAASINEDISTFISGIRKQFPGVLSQNIIFLAEDGLTDAEKDEISNGPLWNN